MQREDIESALAQTQEHSQSVTAQKASPWQPAKIASAWEAAKAEQQRKSKQL